MNINLFDSETILLAVKYNEDDYIVEKEKLGNNYSFLDHVDTYYIIPEYEFSINSYYFRVVDGGLYPNGFGIIAISDDNNTIVYMYYSNITGYIDCENKMTEVIEKYYKYEW